MEAINGSNLKVYNQSLIIVQNIVSCVRA